MSKQLSIVEAMLDPRLGSNEKLDAIATSIDWLRLEPIARRIRTGETGRPPYAPLAMLKALYLQRLYDLSDPGLEEALLDRLSFRRFCGLSLEERTPDETTICRFRAAAAEAGVMEACFAEIARQLEAKGLMLKRGTLMDASIIKAKHNPPTREAGLGAKHPKEPGAPPRVLGISTTAMDDANPRYSTSDAMLEHALAMAGERGAETRLVRLNELKFRPCEGNYSKASHACTWPCAITERDPADQLTPVYEGLVHWADVVLISTSIRWGTASSLYHKMAERLNCIQNQITIANRVLICSKVAGFIITGGQDNIQAVAGGLLTFWSELGFVFPAFPFIAHSRGWDAEDMENNVRQVKASEALRTASHELLDRALDFWRVLDAHRAELARPMERAGRKANPMVAGGAPARPAAAEAAP